MLYILAAWTGLRRGELGSLKASSFRLGASPPTVTVEAAYSKHRRKDEQVLHPSVAQQVKEWMDVESDDEILFPISKVTCGTDRPTSKMLQRDLDSARKIWIGEAKREEERKRREKSDFLCYKNAKGLYADFHAMRHTFITNLCRANVSPKTAQALARHSDIRLTMNVYTHIDQEEQAAAIGKLAGVM
jgi:integrase